MNKTISVWLALSDGGNKGKIALQKRSAEEKNFAFVCQATWAGKVEDNEVVEDAVKRECEEELGREFYDNFDFSKLKLFSENKFDFRKITWTCYNYVGKISEKKLSLTKIHKDALPKFVFVDENNIEEIILFEDQKKVLKDILNED